MNRAVLLTALLVVLSGGYAEAAKKSKGKNKNEMAEIFDPSWKEFSQAQNLIQKYRDSEVRDQLIRTMASHYLAKNDLNKASEILSKNKDDQLYWGRFKYQAGDYKGAAKHYESIARNSDDFIRGLEELAWTRLMMGDLGALRGLLSHLNTELVPVEERLEGRVLSAIGYLKNCQYDDVKRELDLFQKEMLPLVSKIDKADRATKEGTAIRPDFFTRKAKENVTYWESEGDSDKIKEAKQQLAKENARTWMNAKELVSEAILKMRFVKMELLSQMQFIEKSKTKQDILAKNNQIADAGSGKEALKVAGSGKMVFPVKGDVWVDELFNVRAITQTECESIQR